MLVDSYSYVLASILPIFINSHFLKSWYVLFKKDFKLLFEAINLGISDYERTGDVPLSTVDLVLTTEYK